MTLMTLAPILFILCAAAGVAVTNRAQRDLTPEQKAAILDAAPKRQSWHLVAVALVMAAFTVPTLYGLSNRWTSVAFISVMYVLLTVFTVSYMRRVSQSAVPPHYVRAVRLSMWILWISSFLFFAILAFGMWRLFPR